VDYYYIVPLFFFLFFLRRYVFDINNLPEYGWGVVGALCAIVVASFLITGCCVEQAKRRQAYLASLVPE
jgi:hypothetical protein